MLKHQLSLEASAQDIKSYKPQLPRVVQYSSPLVPQQEIELGPKSL